MIFSFFKIKLAKLCVISAESVCQQFDVPLLIISYIDVKTLLSPYDIWSMLNSHPFSKDYPTKGRSKWRLEAGVWAVFIWASSAASSPDCVGWDGRRSATTSLPLSSHLQPHCTRLNQGDQIMWIRLAKMLSGNIGVMLIYIICDPLLMVSCKIAGSCFFVYSLNDCSVTFPVHIF